MKQKIRMGVVWVVTFSAFVSLFAFQAIILVDAYIIKKGIVEDRINALMRSSVEKEVMIRREMSETNKGISFIDESAFKEDTISRSRELFDLNEQELIEAGFFQQVLHNFGFPFNFQTLDSIFSSELKKEKLSHHFSLCFRDSTGVIIEQTKELSPSQIEKAFKTVSLLIVNGKRVQACVIISPPAVFQQMFGLLISSGIIVVFLFLCIFYLSKTIFTQEKLNTLRNDFVNAFVHNIKSPLGTIKTVLSTFILGGFETRPNQKEYWGKMGMKQIDNMQSLAEQILTAARFEKGQLVLNRSKPDMHDMIKELKEKFSISVDKSVSIETSIEIDNDREISLDTLLIKEAISNLLDNAIKYSGDSVEILIDCRTKNDTLQIRVVDNGYGISDKDQKKIYEKFERGAAVDRKEAKGFGLGLSYVKYITEIHGGFVQLFSNVGEGSEFTLIIPIKKNK